MDTVDADDYDKLMMESSLGDQPETDLLNIIESDKSAPIEDSSFSGVVTSSEPGRHVVKMPLITIDQNNGSPKPSSLVEVVDSDLAQIGKISSGDESMEPLIKDSIYLGTEFSSYPKVEVDKIERHYQTSEPLNKVLKAKIKKYMQKYREESLLLDGELNEDTINFP